MPRLHNALRSTRPKIGAAAALLALIAAAGCGSDDASTATTPTTATTSQAANSASVAFAAPYDGDHIAGSIKVALKADGVTIEPAGEAHPGAGHFHLIVDNPCIVPGEAIPKDAVHIHLGKGQTETSISLPTGTHTLCLQVGDGTHIATDITEEIEVTVGVRNLDEWCGVVSEVDTILDHDSLDTPLEELQPVHANVLALIDQLIEGVDAVDAKYRDDVLKVIEGQQTLSTIIVKATDAAEMRAAFEEASKQTIVVDDGTYEYVGTTCGINDDEGSSNGDTGGESTDGSADGSSDAPQIGAASHGDVSVIVDQSPTVSDIDALGFLAARPDVEILAVTMPGTGESDCAPGAVTTRAVLDAAGETDVPIGCGGSPIDGVNDWPTAWSDAADGLAEAVAPGAEEPAYFDAESVLIETLQSADTPVTIVATGPLTNIAAILEREPALAERIEQIVVMGGALAVDGNVEPDFAAEWNFHAHPAAAQAVLSSGVPIALVPLDATNDVPLTAEYIAGVTSIYNPLARVEAATLATLESVDFFFMWDELAAVVAVQPEVATWQERSVVVGADGGTTESPDGAKVKVAGGADAASVRSILLGAFKEFGT